MKMTQKNSILSQCKQSIFILRFEKFLICSIPPLIKQIHVRQISHDLHSIRIFGYHGVHLSKLGIIGQGRLGLKRTPNVEGWRMEAFLRVRPFKDEFKRQTVQISKSGRGRINIHNLDPNPDILVQI